MTRNSIDSNPRSRKFPTWLLLILGGLVVTSLGCSSANNGLLEGTSWESKAGEIDGQKMPEKALTLAFGKDGKLTYQIEGAAALEGTYKLGMGNTVTFEFEQEIGSHKTHLEQIQIKGDTLTMVDSDGSSLDFLRK